jgi:hypothetical protein
MPCRNKLDTFNCVFCFGNETRIKVIFEIEDRFNWAWVKGRLVLMHMLKGIMYGGMDALKSQNASVIIVRGIQGKNSGIRSLIMKCQIRKY